MRDELDQIKAFLFGRQMQAINDLDLTGICHRKKIWLMNAF